MYICCALFVVVWCCLLLFDVVWCCFVVGWCLFWLVVAEVRVLICCVCRRGCCSLFGVCCLFA